MNRKDTHSQSEEHPSEILPLSELQNEVDAAAAEGIFPPIEVEVLATKPISLLVSPKAGGSLSDLDSALGFIASRLFCKSGDSEQTVLFRGVKLTRLGQIMDTGCDVTPSTAPIYASRFAGKAMEYGDVVMAFDSAKLDKTYRKVSKSENPEILSRLKEQYSTVLEVGDSLWFSKLPPDDERIGTMYESYYTFFIPGDPREALLLLFLIGHDREELRTEFLRWSSGGSRPAPPRNP